METIIGQTFLKGKTIKYMICPDEDYIMVNLDTVYAAIGERGKMSEFLTSDAWLDIMLHYKRVTGKDYALNYMNIDDGSGAREYDDIESMLRAKTKER